MGSFPHPMQYFAAAGEKDDFVIAVINFPLNQYPWELLCYLFAFRALQISNMKTNENFLKYYKNLEILGHYREISRFLKYFFKFLFVFIFEIWKAKNANK